MADNNLKPENRIDERYQDLLNHPEKRELGDRAQEAQSDYAKGGIDELEKLANSGSEKSDPDNEFGYSQASSSGQQRPSIVNRATKLIASRKGASTGIAGSLALIAGVFGFGGFAGFGSIMLVHVKETFTNYGSSAGRAADPNFERTTYYRLNNSNSTEKACGSSGAINSVKCRRGTVSAKNHDALIDQKFDVDSKEINGRYVIRSIARDGITINSGSTQRQVASALRSTTFGGGMRQVHNPRVSVYVKGKFSDVLRKYNQNKAKLDVSGEDDEERRASIDKITGAADEDTPDKRMSKFSADYEDKIKSSTNIPRASAVPTGVVCGSYNAAKATLTAVKLYNASRYVGYAMVFLKAADQIKTEGSIEPETASLLGGVLASSYASGDMKGMTATDSAGYKTAAYGGVRNLPSFAQRFLLNGNTNLITLDKSIKEAEDLAGGRQVLKAGCDITSSYAFQGATIVALCANPAFIACVGKVIVQAVATGAAANKLIAEVFPYVIKALANTPVGIDDLKGPDAGNVLAAGAGVVMETSNMSYGMQPGTKDSVIGFNSGTQVSTNSYDAIARNNAKSEPLDIYNEYSVLGSFVRTAGLTSLNPSSPASLLTTVGGVVSRAAIKPSSAGAVASMPLNITKEDLSHCPESNVQRIGIDCDAYGGIQFVTNTTITDEESLNFMVGKYVDEDGEPINDTYQKWVDNCTDNRDVPLGYYFGGIEDLDVWKNGEACVAGSNVGINAGTRDQFSNFWFDQAAGDDEDYVPPAPGSNTGTYAGGNVRVTSFNVLGASHSRGDYKARMDKSINVIKDNQLEIVGMQEFQPPQRSYFKSKVGDTYKMYPNTKGNDAVNAIVWDTNSYKLVSSGMMPNLKYFRGSKLHAPWVLLENKSSGQRIYYLNTHDPANSNGPAEALRLHNAEQHRVFIEKLKEKNVPVILTGDFNSPYIHGGGGPNGALNGQNKNLTYCVLTKGNFMANAYDKHTKRPVKCPNKADPKKAGVVDHIYISPELNVSDFFLKAKGKSNNGGDHPTIIADVAIPGGEGVEAGEWKFPVDKKWWAKNPSDFLGPHISTGTAWGGDNMGTTSKGAFIASDIGDPPDGSPVYAMVGGTVTSTSLCGSNDGVAIKTKVGGDTIGIAYMHGTGKTVKTGDKVKAGQMIMKVGTIGCSVSGGHVHIGIAYNGKYVCPQDVFLSIARGKQPDLGSLVSKAKPPCGRGLPPNVPR